MGAPGAGTVWTHTRYEIEVLNPATLQSRAIIAVVIEITAPATPLSRIKNTRCDSKKYRGFIGKLLEPFRDHLL